MHRPWSLWEGWKPWRIESLPPPHLRPVLSLIQCWAPGGVWNGQPPVRDRRNQNRALATPVLETLGDLLRSERLNSFKSEEFSVPHRLCNNVQPNRGKVIKGKEQFYFPSEANSLCCLGSKASFLPPFCPKLGWKLAKERPLAHNLQMTWLLSFTTNTCATFGHLMILPLPGTQTLQSGGVLDNHL